MWLLPSRRRPASLARFFDAYRATSGSTPGIVLVDRADYAENQAQYEAIVFPLGWHIVQTAGERQGDKIAEAWAVVKDCSWLGLIGDDCVPETPAWDRLLVDRLEVGNFVYCDDGWQAPARVGNCWVIAGELIRAVGYIFPPGLQHLFVDDVWETIGREAGCAAYRPDVMVRHRHVLKGEAPADATHRLVYGAATFDRAQGLWPEDTAVFEAWLAGDRYRAVAAAAALQPKPTRVETETDPAGDPAAARRIARAQGRKVMVATPIARAPCWQYTLAFAETLVLLRELGIAFTTRFLVGSSNLPRARNILAARFLESGFDDLLFIDDDMGWRANSVLRLIASEQPLIGAVGRKKLDLPDTDPHVWCCQFDPANNANGGAALPRDDMGAVEVARLGAGMVKISRQVFEQMIAAHPGWKRDGDPELPAAIRAHYYRFFCFNDDEGGEDYHFCDRWRELGGKVWIDPSIALTHSGDKAWGGAVTALMAEGPASSPLQRLSA